MGFIENSKQILLYFFNLTVNISSEGRFYSESFLFKIKKLKGFFFFVLKLLSSNAIHENFSFFSTVLLKNLFKFNPKGYYKNSKHILFCLVEISSSCCSKLSREINRIILFIIKYRSRRSLDGFTLIATKTQEKLLSKFFFKNKWDFLYSILSVAKILVFLYSYEKNFFLLNCFKNLEKICNDISISVGFFSKIHSIETEIQISVLSSLAILFGNVNKNCLITFTGQNLRNWMLIFIITLGKNKHSYPVKKAVMKLKQTIIIKLTELVYFYQNEFCLYLPILCKLGLESMSLPTKRKFTSSIKVLVLISNSINKLIILKNPNFIKSIQNLSFTIILNHSKTSFRGDDCFFLFSNQKFNFEKRIRYTLTLTGSIPVEKRNDMLNFYCNLDFRYNCSCSYFLYALSSIIIHVLFYFTDNFYTRQIRITRQTINITHMYKVAISKNRYLKTKKSQILCLDFFSFFYYQFPAKFLAKHMFLVFDFYTNIVPNIHLLYTIGCILNTKGNDGQQSVMWYTNRIQQKKILLFFLAKYKQKNLNFEIEINFKKIFLQIVLGNFNYKKTYRNVLYLYVLNILKNLINRKKNFNLVIYDFELSALAIFFYKKSNDNLFRCILDMNFYIIAEQQIDVISCTFDLFTSIILTDDRKIKLEIIFQLLKSIIFSCLGVSKILVKSVFKCIKIFIVKKKLIKKRELVFLFCIFEIILIEYGEHDCLDFFLVYCLNLIQNNLEFIVHFAETLSKKNRISLHHIFITLLVNRIGIFRSQWMLHEIRRKYVAGFFVFYFLINNFLSIKLETIHILAEFFYAFYNQILTSILINLPNFTKLAIYQIVLFSKILKKTPRSTRTDFSSSIRFNNYNQHRNHFFHKNKSIVILNKVFNYIISIFFTKKHTNL